MKVFLPPKLRERVEAVRNSARGVEVSDDHQQPRLRDFARDMKLLLDLLLDGDL